MPREIDPNHRVIIQSKEIKPEVIAYSPPEYSLAVSSSWDSPYADLTGGSVGTALNATGLTVKNKATSTLIWSGSTPIELSLPLQFFAESDAGYEVRDPILRLMKMAVPGELDAGLYTPPGPTYVDVKKLVTEKGYKGGDYGGGDKIDVLVGRFLRFTNVVISAVSVTYGSSKSPEGIPINAEAELSFSTHTTLAKDDLTALFTGAS